MVLRLFAAIRRCSNKNITYLHTISSSESIETDYRFYVARRNYFFDVMFPGGLGADLLCFFKFLSNCFAQEFGYIPSRE